MNILTTHIKAATTPLPLVVDLDGTLIRSDLLIESFAAGLRSDPLAVIGTSLTLRAGKAQLKAALAQTIDIDPALLPYDEDVLARIRVARAAGRRVYLASASNEKYVAAIARHLELFDGWFGSDGTRNLSGPIKAAMLSERFGIGGFGYIGNEEADLAVWGVAADKTAVRASAHVRRKLLAMDPEAAIVSGNSPSWRDWLKLLRVHQYAKNALIVVPLLTAHRFDMGALLATTGAVISFSLCASAVYLLNDLIDLNADRSHSTKRTRPFAAGTVGMLEGSVAIPLLLLTSFALAAVISTAYVMVLAAYFALTTVYTLVLKRKMLVDTIVLAMLYTIRVVAGAAAIGVSLSEWLLAFSLFFFTALALIKRYVELTRCFDAGRPDPTNRNYKTGDLDVIAALAAAAGFNSITVFALYVSSDAVHKLYAHPERLWLVCPVLMYWIGRALMMAHRRLMNDDPIIFALRDRNSLAAAGVIGIVAIAATF